MTQASRPAPAQAEAQIRRVLGRLKCGAMLRPSAAGYSLVERQVSSAAARREPLPSSLIEHCLDRDLLERHRGQLILSDTGRAWLRRTTEAEDAYREQHQLLSLAEREVDGVRRQVLVNEAESPLGWLKSRKDRNGRPLISDTQYEAGERLRADYWLAQLSPRLTANWSSLAPAKRLRRSAPSNHAGFSDNALAAKQRVLRALAEVGPELAGVLIDICCELKGLEDAEKANGWPQRAGKVVLQIALTRLARHYGLLGNEAAGRVSRGLRHWGSEDYRPTLDAWRGTDAQ